jgi:hypothetical protein
LTWNPEWDADSRGLRGFSRIKGGLEHRLQPALSSTACLGAEIKGAIRFCATGDLLLQPVYTVALTNRWRVKLGAAVFAGPSDGFLGQYRESSHVSFDVRYTF